MAHRARGGLLLFSKVPEIAFLFWVVKLLTTAMGEATSDYFVYTMNPYIVVICGALFLALTLAFQLLMPRYVAWVYWLVVAMVAIFGTMVADVIHIVLHVPYADSTAAFAIVLVAVFFVWHKVEGTLSIHSIFSPRREAFYWATVLATFALGTAWGDMTARTLQLGYLASAVIFAGLFLLPFVARRLFGLHEVFAFWFAYVMTRPLGASVADWLGMPKSVGGLGYGRGLVALCLTVLIVAVVAHLARTHKDVQSAQYVPEDGAQQA